MYIKNTVTPEQVAAGEKEYGELLNNYLSTKAF